MNEGYTSGDGVRLHYVETGAGAPVLLLHGFPDFWYTWRHLLPALAQSGLRACAIDLRGYNLSDRPRDVDAYRMDRLVADVARVISDRCGGRAALVGHDWGGVIGWYVATAAPQLVTRLAVLNAPHPARYHQLLRHPLQLLRSWYALALQLPWLPERLLAARRAALLRFLLVGGSAAPDAFTPADLERYAAAFDSPEAFRGPLNYYRAAARDRRRAERGGAMRTSVPTLLFWGEGDTALDARNTTGLEQWVERLTIVRIPAAKHWVHLDAVDRVNRELITFLRD